ncbi:oxidoreductase [Sphaerisporangium melleum]|uniref:Oxidoreductase n=1 Tax=Sphaerisporangium melleum TaxID=321316 RepID=A0A917RFY1_9ACTN|nr:oxidoreductase [Sphaerisporangium melleum]GII74104.1 oxidoreductase [Sphaerisporangium melleum]
MAVAGLGAIAQLVHLPMLERRGDLFETVALCDPSATLTARTAVRYGVARRYTDVTAMLDAGGFDAVLVLTSGSHGRVVADALRRGHAVLCEKPLAYTRAEVAEIAALEDPDRPRLMVGYMKQYDPAVQRMAGRRLDVRAVQVTVLRPSDRSQLAFARLPAPPADVPAEVTDRLRAQDDALVRAAIGDAHQEARWLYTTTMNSISHDLSLLRLLAGGPSEVDHATTWPGAGGRSVELSGPLRAGGRYAVHWHYLSDYPAYRETVAVHHATGTSEVVFPTPYLPGAAARLTDVGADGRLSYSDVTGSFERELAAFHEMVTDGVPPLTGLRGALEDVVTAQQAVTRLLQRDGLTPGGEAHPHLELA